MRNLCWIIVASCFVTLNLAATPDRDDDVAPLRNWQVAFDQVIHTNRAESWQPVADTVTLPSAATHFIAVTPCRLVDTRNPNGPFGGPIFQAGDTRSYNIPAASVAAACGVPSAIAYSLNFTIANYSGRGNLKAYPTGTTPPLVSTLNYGSGLPLGNAAIVPADGNGSIDVAAAVTAQPGPTNVIIDINGYFASGVVTSLTAGTGLTVTGTGDLTVGITPQGVGSAQLGPNAVTSGAINPGAVGAAQIADGSVGPVKLDATGSSSGQVLTSTGAAVAWQSLPAINAWSLTGNLGTSSALNFLGTTDNNPLLFKVNGLRALQMEPADANNSPNLIGGYSGNAALAGVKGATIGGGGQLDDGSVPAANSANRVTDDYGTVAGGAHNQAGDSAGMTTDHAYASVGGGNLNVASGAFSTVGGGYNNVAAGGYSAVPGGLSNIASGYASFAAGIQAQALHTGSFVWGDGALAPFASTGPDQFLIHAAGGVGIGTNAPKRMLHISSTGANTMRVETLTDSINPVIEIVDNSPGQARFQGINFVNAAGSNVGAAAGQIGYTTNTNGMYFSTNSTFQMVIDSTGRVGIGNFASSTAKLDVNGVIRSSTGGFRFPDNTVQTTAATGITLVRTVIVSPAATAVLSGTALKSALAGITTASPTNPWLLKIEPGIYDLGNTSLTMKQNVDIEGSGELATIITTTGSRVVNGADNAEIRSLTIRNTFSSGQGTGILNNSASPRIRQVTVAVSGSTTEGFGIANSSSSPTISNVTITCTGGSSCAGIENDGASAPVIQNSSIVADTSPVGYGVLNFDSGIVKITSSQITGSTNSIATFSSGTTFVAVSEIVGGASVSDFGTNRCVGAYNSTFSALDGTCN